MALLIFSPFLRVSRPGILVVRDVTGHPCKVNWERNDLGESKSNYVVIYNLQIIYKILTEYRQNA